MAEIKVGYGRNLEHYKTESIEYKNLDITINLENGDVIKVNAREHGYALRFSGKGKNKQTLKDIDY